MSDTLGETFAQMSAEDLLAQIQETCAFLKKEQALRDRCPPFWVVKATWLLKAQYQLSMEDMRIFDCFQRIIIDFGEVANPQALVEQCELIRLLMRTFRHVWIEQQKVLVFTVREVPFVEFVPMEVDVDVQSSARPCVEHISYKFRCVAKNV